MKRELILAVLAVLALCFIVPYYQPPAHAQGAFGTWVPVGYLGETTTVLTVKGSAGALGNLVVDNTVNASASTCIQLFDVAPSTTVTLGTTVPKITFTAPAAGSGNFVQPTGGVNFINGIKLAAATTCSGNTAPGTGVNIDVMFQ